MKPVDVVFVVLPGTMLMDLAGVGEPFRVARKFGADYRLHFVGPTADPKSFLGLSLQGVAPLPEALPDGAIVFVPGVAMRDGASGETVHEGTARWLRRVVDPGHTLCTVCSGAFVAARAGLLDGRQCTTHFDFAARLAREHPRARVLENRIFVRDGNLYTSAGITAGTDLALHLIAETAGPLVAVEVARFLVIYLRRGEGDPQLSPWLDHRNHIDGRIHALQDLIVRDPGAEWSVDALAERIHTSPRHLTRLFTAHAGVSPLTYLRKVRTAAARELVAHSQLSLERVAEMAGFSSVGQMRRAWNKFERVRPTDVRRGTRAGAPAHAGSAA